MDKIAEIEKIKKELEKEAQTETPDIEKLNQLKRNIIQLGLGLTFNDIYKR